MQNIGSHRQPHCHSSTAKGEEASGHLQLRRRRHQQPLPAATQEEGSLPYRLHGPDRREEVTDRRCVCEHGRPATGPVPARGKGGEKDRLLLHKLVPVSVSGCGLLKGANASFQGLV